jgi:DNA-binding SARP family transcriptional activator/WD40 repeat protein/energy-coupling factor transporter ATP-binding protein EcfA2
VEIRVLGALSVAADGTVLAPRDRVVLAALVVGRAETVRAETLADALWIDANPPASWTKVIQGCIVRIRKVLGTSIIETDGKGYRLVASPDDIDARRFERLLSRARELLALGEADRAMFTADEALSLWRGRPLAELDEWEPGRIEAARLGELHLDAEELRIEAGLRAGRYREVLADATAAAARAPLREHRWALVALAQHQAGRQADALRTLHEARRMLVRELGIDPSDEIVAVEAAILRQDPSLIAPGLIESSDVCPFLGLSSYEAADADIYFGRVAEVQQCLDRLRSNGVLAVVGPSGSGKSSLLRAGLMPAVQRAGHRVDLVTPGEHPMRSLDSVTPIRRGESVALVIDQCEEAVTMCSDPAERQQFLDAVVASAARGPLLIGFRADRLGELTRHAEFATLVERGLYLLTPMTTTQLREAIEAPARHAGILFEPGLVDLLIREVQDEPGSLPLLSHALFQTWHSREGNTLTVAGYRAAGGIRGAVAQSAEDLYEHIPTERRRMLRNLMLRLVTTTTAGEPVRARVARRIVAPDEEREQLLDALVDARLVTSDAHADGATVELAHEALVRAWPRLKDWLDDDAEGQRIWRHLAAAADNWQAMGRPDSELYRGVRLARVLEWREQTMPDLHPMECEFLDTSAQVADAERISAEQQARQQARENRRLRILVGGIAVLVGLTAAGGVTAMRQADRADREAEQARSHELATAAIGAIDDDPSLAKLLAVAAADTDEPTLAAVAALHETYAADPAVVRWGFVGEVGVLDADISAAGDRIAAAGIFQGDGAGWTLSVADVATGRTVWSRDLSTSGEASVALAEPRFTPDGQHVIAGVYWDPYSWRRQPIAFDGVDEPTAELLGAHIWNATTGELVERFDLGHCGGVVSGVSETHLLARTLHGDPDVVRECRWRDGTIGVELVDRSDGERIVLTTATDTPWHLGAAMSEDGSVVAFDDGPSGTVVVVDVAGDAELARLSANGVRDIDPTGDRVLVGWHEVQVWDVATGEAVARVDVANGGRSADSRFGPDGGTVFSSSGDGTVRQWHATTGDQLAMYPGLGSGPIHASPTGLVSVSNPDQQIVTVIDTRRRGQLGSVDLCTGSIVDDTLAVADGRAFVHATCDGEPAASRYTIDLGDGSVVRRDQRRAAAALALSPDGSSLVDQELDERPDGSLVSARLFVASTGTGDTLFELDGLPGNSTSPTATRLRWSPDGNWIGAALGPRVAVWDASDGALVHSSEVEARDAVFVDLAFTPDSSALIATSSDRVLMRRPLDSWEDALVQATTIDGANSIGLAGFAVDGSTVLAVGGYQAGGSALAWFDATTLAQERLLPTIHEGTVSSAAISDDGAWLATAAMDGSIRVWDATSGDLVHDAGRRDGPVRGIAFVGERELIVAVDGWLDRITIDPDGLVDLVRASLNRGFTQSECSRFNFHGDCPTLAELQHRPADPGTPEGSFRISWTADDFSAAAVEDIRQAFGAPVWDDFTIGFAADFAGSYTLGLHGARFDLTRHGVADPVCTGSIRVLGTRISLLAERGAYCYPSILLEADFTVTRDELRFVRDGLRAEFPSTIVFGTHPLERAG